MPDILYLALAAALALGALLLVAACRKLETRR